MIVPFGWRLRMTWRRSSTHALALVLLAFAVLSVTVSWRHADAVDTATEAVHNVDRIQAVTLLAARERLSVRGALLRDGATEIIAFHNARSAVAAALPQLASVDAGDAARHDEIAAAHDRYVTAAEDMFDLLVDGFADDAEALLAAEVRPRGALLRDLLDHDVAIHRAAYSRDLDAARRGAELLRVFTPLLYMAVLGLVTVFVRLRRRHGEHVDAHARRDPLTGFANRHEFYVQANQALREAADDQTPAGQTPPDGAWHAAGTALLVDLDGFAEVNDTFGHPAGDALLREFAHRLRRGLRAIDLLARLGGDQFVVLLRQCDGPAAEAVARGILGQLEEPFVLEGVPVAIEASIGLAVAVPGEDVAAALRRADIAMHAAKERRLGYLLYDPTHEYDTAARLTLLGELRRALDHDEIVLHYQPKLAVADQRPVGVEALARWQHPDRGLLGPGVFLPVLERTSLSHRFTVHVLTQALAQTSAWLQQGLHVPVSVNVSSPTLLEPGFVDTVADLLRAIGVPGELLCVEITEGTIMSDPQRAIAVLGQLRALGIRLAIDDFGTGYSSMAYLKVLPVDELKIDRSFVRDMATNPNDAVLVASTVNLGHHLGMAVTAEGVEDAETLQILHTIGCDLAQGYLFSPPLPASGATVWLRTSDTSAAGELPAQRQSPGAPAKVHGQTAVERSRDPIADRRSGL
jgi:diguanylate cyclase (GGDEF)-like protein